jgi:hypothetical protein
MEDAGSFESAGPREGHGTSRTSARREDEPNRAQDGESEHLNGRELVPGQVPTAGFPDEVEEIQAHRQAIHAGFSHWQQATITDSDLAQLERDYGIGSSSSAGNTCSSNFDLLYRAYPLCSCHEPVKQRVPGLSVPAALTQQK